MKKIYVLLPSVALLAAPGLSFAAQPTATAGSHNPALKDSTPHSTAAPAKGISSFTEDQARGRLAKAGYTRVSKLKKSSSGAWMGTATKGGKTFPIALDYKGNITAR